MNNKILLSVAAAATLAMTFTGCGSSSTTASTEDVSGSAVKAELNGATVSFGGQTATTDSDGAFTVTGTAGSTAIEVSDGNYTLNNITKVNGMVLKATKAQVNSGAPTSMLTTLIEEFGDVETAFNALGLDYDADTTDLSTVDAGDFENAAVAVAMLMEMSTSLGDAMSSLKSQSTNKLSLTQLAAAITTAATEGGVTDANLLVLNAVTAAVVDGKPLGYALAMVNAGDANLTYDETAYQMTNVIDTNATDTDASDDIISFDMTNSAADLTNANGNTSLYLSIKGTDVANLNTSYFMGLSNLDIATSGNDITLNNANATAIMNTVANSNMSYALTLDTNASALDASSIFSGNDLNVTAFTNYVESMYAADGSATIGSFDMANGNYSVKVYVDVNGVKITKDNRLTDIISSSMSITDSEDETLFSDERAYKVIDTNLTK